MYHFSGLNYLNFIFRFSALISSFSDDEHDDDDDELFLQNGWPTKGVYALFPAEPLSEILIIANLRHAESRVWTCAQNLSSDFVE